MMKYIRLNSDPHTQIQNDIFVVTFTKIRVFEYTYTRINIIIDITVIFVNLQSRLFHIIYIPCIALEFNFELIIVYFQSLFFFKIFCDTKSSA